MKKYDFVQIVGVLVTLASMVMLFTTQFPEIAALVLSLGFLTFAIGLHLEFIGTIRQKSARNMVLMGAIFVLIVMVMIVERFV